MVLINKPLFVSLVFVLISVISQNAFSYPQFISYGYTSCLTCHSNSLGGGALNDYGRALFSQEIAGRAFVPKSVSDEKLADYSGIAGQKKLPYWFRPSIKYRGLYLASSPTSLESQRRWIHMQQDVGIVFSFDQDQKTIFSVSYSQLSKAQDYYHNGKTITWASKEHYLRTFLDENNLVAAGLMDKAYGLRHPDHTAPNRSWIGNGQDDAVHGVLLHHLVDPLEWAVHLFIGNQLQESSYQQKGFSLFSEYGFSEKNRLGLSFMNYKTGFSDSTRFSAHQRLGLAFTKGSSIMWEAGFKKEKTLSTQVIKDGNYLYVEANISLNRGYNFISAFDRYRAEGDFSSPDVQRWTFGFLLFPVQRTEVRLNAVQTKTYTSEAAFSDGWSLQGQLHVSL